MSLIEELKRRNVFRVVAAYAVVGWVVLEVASIVAPALGLPDWTITMLLFAGVCGLPFAVLFAWAFELTPEGLKRTADVTADESIATQTGSKLTKATIALLSIALLLVLGERFFIFEPEHTATEVTVEAIAKDTPSSIAVLPFVNMSDDKANEHFGDGLAEELLNLLAQVPELHVAARTSTFYFKDKDTTIADIAGALGVDTVLEGSVRRSGDTIRVVAQLISATDERHLWSQKYDRPLTDVFVVQDDIARQIVRALMPHLDQELPATSEQGVISPDLYERFLLARHTYYESKNDSTVAAHKEFLAITEAAPGFSPAWSWLARSWLELPDTPSGVAWPSARQAIDTALRLNPKDANAYLALARLNRSEGDQQQALINIDKALALDQRFVEALILSEHVLVSLGRVDEAIANLEQARALDPLHPEVLSSLAHLLNLQGHRQEAFAMIDKLYRVNAVRAKTDEEHLYRDNQEVARAIYFAELDGADGAPDLCQECFAGRLLGDGLYEHPVLQASTYRPVALANMGDRHSAELALVEVQAEMQDPREKVNLQILTYTALAEYQLVSDLLWAYWQSLDSDHLSDAFGVWEAMSLAKAARQVGDEERVQTMLPFLAREMATWSTSHAAAYNPVQAQLALLQGRNDHALHLLEESARNGYIGDYYHGGPILFQFQVPDEPRFNTVVERMEANYNFQLALLDELRASGISAAEMRREYLQQ